MASAEIDNKKKTIKVIAVSDKKTVRSQVEEVLNAEPVMPLIWKTNSFYSKLQIRIYKEDLKTKQINRV